MFETDVYNFGLILEELAKKIWSNLEEVFKTPLLGMTEKKANKEGEVEVVQRNAQKDSYEEVIKPKLMMVLAIIQEKRLNSVPRMKPWLRPLHVATLTVQRELPKYEIIFSI